MGRLLSILGELSSSGLVLSTEQLLDAACLALLSDGEATDEEVAWLVPFLSEAPALATKDRTQVHALIDAAFDRLTAHANAESATTAFAGTLQTRAQREQAFAVVAAVQHADGQILGDENELILDLIDALPLDEARANEILSMVAERVVE